ncbi:MAG: insulinase family protein [Alphaproteobacteria bacterium]|nr:insulinase family protein [Alphaproteobacteria bacterium]
MNKLLYYIVFAFFVFAFSAHAKLFDAHEFELSNGLKVVVVENHKAPIVKMMLWYQVGAMDEKAGKSGLAHLLEHLMFRGTSKVPASAFNDIMLKNGVDFNAFTSYDFTVYHALADVSRIELVLALEADRMTGLKINQEAFEGEQKIVYQERQQRVENNPKSRFSEEMHQILWKNTPYEHPVSGTLAEINDFIAEDALNFYNTFYAPNNALLVLSGDITMQEAEFLAQKYFEKIPSKALPENRKMTFKVEDEGVYMVFKDMEDVANTKLSISYIIPSMTENTKQAFALSVFSSYFGEGGSSYLERELVEKKKLISASSSVDVFSRGSGVFQISALPFEGANSVLSIKLLEDSLKKALNELTEAKLEKEKKKMLSGLVYTQDNPSNAAYLVGLFVSLGLGLEKLENYADEIKAVKLEDIKSAITHMLEHSKTLKTVLKPKENANE